VAGGVKRREGCAPVVDQPVLSDNLESVDENPRREHPPGKRFAAIRSDGNEERAGERDGGGGEPEAV
jgi:hypothetical protein